MGKTRAKRDIDWTFFTVPTTNIIKIRNWEEDNLGVTVPTSSESNKFVFMPVYWENSSGVQTLTSATLGGIAGTIINQQSIVTTFGNGIAFVYWTEAQYASLPVSASPVFTFAGGTPDQAVQYSSVVYANVNQGSFEVDSGFQTNAGNLNINQSLTTEDGGVGIVAFVSGTSAASVTVNCSYPTVITEDDQTEQNAGVFEEFPTTAPNDNFTFDTTGSNRTAVIFISLRRA